ncbi:hypothetical protein ACNQFN_09370 [Thauera butanivorans]|uniref:hypothetical protein n=1 Tax=Thauera butanivorans TaxID=86174 RepID=UPI003AB3BFB6
MNTLTVHCPSCGSPSHLSETNADPQGTISAAFKCSNTACRGEFGGVLTLTRGLPPGLLRFSSGAGRQDAYLTDC